MPEQLALEVHQPQSGMELMNQALQTAIAQGGALEVVDRLIKARAEMIEYQAKVAFEDSLQKAQAEIKRVHPDLTNTQTSSKYASYPKLDAAVRPTYSREGISISFSEGESGPEEVRLIAYVSKSGHTREYRVNIPTSTKGPKGNDVMTRTHAHVSGISYGKSALIKMIFNLAVGDVNDDGNAAAGLGAQAMDDTLFIQHRDNIANAASKGDVNKFYIAAIKAAKGDQNAVSDFEREATRRVKEL